MGRHFNRAIVKSVNRAFLREVPRVEAEAMLEGEFPTARRISRVKDVNLVVQLLNVERLNDCDPCTITASEMMANAGLCGKPMEEKHDENGVLVRRDNFAFEAKSKISAWPFIGDSKAVRVAPRVAPVLATLLMILASAHSFAQCGKERWGAKLNPPAAKTIINSSVDHLRAIPSYSKSQLLQHPNDRFPEEMVTYRINAILSGYKQETDGDFHLVLSDPQSGHTMIAEIPSPACTKNALLKKLWASERAFISKHGTVTAKLRKAKVMVLITGPLFFDFMHGQTGVAPNGVELHPVMAIEDSLPKKGPNADENAARSGQSYSTSQPGVSQRKLVQLDHIQ